MANRSRSLMGLIIAVAFGVLVASPAAKAQWYYVDQPANWYYVNNQPVSPEMARAMNWQGLRFGYYYYAYGNPPAQTQDVAPTYNPAIADTLRRGNNVMTDLTIGQIRAMNGGR